MSEKNDYVPSGHVKYLARLLWDMYQYTGRRREWTVTDMAKMLYFSRPYTRQIVNEMVEHGWLEKREYEHRPEVTVYKYAITPAVTELLFGQIRMF